MIDPVIRSLGPADLEQLAELQDEARAALSDQRGGTRWLDEHTDRQWERRPDAVTVIVGELDGVLTGYLLLEHVPGAVVASVEEVFVAEWARHLGYGDGLLAEAVARATAAGAAYLEATALPGDRETKNLYERAGITARAITVSTALAVDSHID
jgi:ribosomal protein S18 acetylase RimI-like enzyme